MLAAANASILNTVSGSTGLPVTWSCIIGIRMRMFKQRSQLPEFKAVTRKIKGGFASSVFPAMLTCKGGRWTCRFIGDGAVARFRGSGVDLFNHLYHFYFR